MATGKFWECMGEYGRRHPPTPEATEDKPAATQTIAIVGGNTLILSHTLSYSLILSHTLPYFPTKAAINHTARVRGLKP